MGDRIGNRIKELRVMRGLTQEELGAIVGVKKAAINKYESGLVKNIKRDMQAKLAAALNTDPASLFYADAADSKLTRDERNLISTYRSLNEEGQEKVRDYAADLVAAGRYIKSDPDRVVDEA